MPETSEIATYITEVLNSEDDAFRLVIRAHAAIDDQLEVLLRDAFIGGVPRFLERLGFANKVDLVVGLGLVPPAFGDVLARLNKLRNELAHGRLADISLARARDLAGALGAVVPDLAPLVTTLAATDTVGVERSVLKFAIGATWGLLAAAQSEVNAQRARIKEALAALEHTPLERLLLNEGRLGESTLG